MSIRRFFQITVFLAAMAVAFSAPLAGSANACVGGPDGGGDC